MRPRRRARTPTGYLGPDTQDLNLPADTELSDEIQSRASRFATEITSTPGFVESLLPDLARVTQPALLIKGEHDPVTRPEEIERFRADVAGGVYHHAPGVGHFVHAEAPADYARLVTGFVLN